MRKVKITVLLISGLVFRTHIITAQILFFWLLTGQWKWAITSSLSWNLVNTVLYYNFHYWLARIFKVGK